MFTESQPASEPQVLHYGHLRPDPRWRMAEHGHRHHETIVVLAGVLHVELGGESLHAGKGEVLLYRAGTPHSERSDLERPSEICFLAWQGDCAGLPTQVEDRTGRMRTLLSWYEHDEELGLHGAVDLRREYLCLFFAEYRKAVAIELEPQDPFHRVVNLMTAHMHEALTLDDFASEAGMSRSHFVRAYKAARGLTPMQDLRRHRVERARRLMITTDLSLAAIAEQVGLANAYHLSRLFRREHGVPPGAMRRATRRQVGER